MKINISNRVTTIILISGIFIYSSNNIHGQGLFLDKGVSGFGVDVYYSTNEGISGIGGGIGYSVLGILDLQFGVASVSFPEEDYGDDFKGLGLYPGIVFHALKQTDIIPVSLYAHVSYGHYKYSGGILEMFDWEMDGSSVSIGLGLNHRVYFSSNVSIIPGIKADYTTFKSEIIDSSGNSEKDKDDSVSIGVSLPFAFDLPTSSTLYVSPRLSFDNETAIFSLTIGLVFSTNTISSME